MTQGMFVMKAIPLHLGHIHAINLAASQCSRLFVILCHSESDSEYFQNLKLNPVPWKIRLKWLKEIYNDIAHVKILQHFEDGIPPYPHGWKEWSESIKTLLWGRGIELDDNKRLQFKWFSSEVKDQENARKHFPSVDFVLIDPGRKNVPISATKIRRGGIYKYWQYLPGVVRPYFAKKVVIVGTESTGKTTLVKFLAKKFNTSWTEEYGRDFVETECFGDETLLKFDDFATIAMRHKQYEADALRSANMVTFSDTEAIVTQFYCGLYEGRKNPIVDAIARSQEYDLWLFTCCDVPWVADGVRLHSGDREMLEDDLLDLLAKYGVAPKELYPLNGSYYRRMQLAIGRVEELLKL